MKNIFEITLWIALPFSLAVISSCKDDSNPVNKIEDIVFPEKNISYYRTIQPLFNIGCATDGCHDTKTKAGNLELSDYYGIRYGKPGVVTPYDTLTSRLIWSIEGSNGSFPMPPQRLLTRNQIAGFKQWIMEGATDTLR